VHDAAARILNDAAAQILNEAAAPAERAVIGPLCENAQAAERFARGSARR